MTPRRAILTRCGFGATVVAVGSGLVVQLILVISGRSVLTAEQEVGLAARLGRFVGYYTIQSNLLSLVVAATLLRRPGRLGGLGWRVARLDMMLGMTVTGLVHWFLLRPLLHLQGWAYVTDKILHVVDPLLVLIGWLIFGPRPRINLRVALLALLWPIVWVLVILVQAPATGWYPYPFLNVEQNGLGAVVIACLGITVAFLLLDALFWLIDRRLPRTGESDPESAENLSPSAGTLKR